MGAVVEMLAVGTGQHLLAYTDADGHFTIAGLDPGNYDMRVTAPSFLPTVREDVALAAGATKDRQHHAEHPVRSGPHDACRASAINDDDDSWKWTLRSTANRPILRFDDGIPVVVEADQQDRTLRGSLAFMAGGANEGYGSAV